MTPFLSVGTTYGLLGFLPYFCTPLFPIFSLSFPCLSRCISESCARHFRVQSQVGRTSVAENAQKVRRKPAYHPLLYDLKDWPSRYHN